MKQYQVSITNETNNLIVIMKPIQIINRNRSWCGRIVENLAQMSVVIVTKVSTTSGLVNGFTYFLISFTCSSSFCIQFRPQTAQSRAFQRLHYSFQVLRHSRVNSGALVMILVMSNHGHDSCMYMIHVWVMCDSCMSHD